MLSDNKKVFNRGKILNVTRLPIIRIVLGEAISLEDVPKFIWRSRGKIAIKNENIYEVYYYLPNEIIVLDLVIDKKNEKILYHIHSPNAEYTKRNYGENIDSNPLALKLLSDEEFGKIDSILKLLNLDISNLDVQFLPAKENINVIVIDENVLNGANKVKCNLVGLPSYVFTNLFRDDVFEIESKEKMSGYKISKGIFKYNFRIENEEPK